MVVDADPDKRDALRDIADELRTSCDQDEVEQIAAILYRVSDIYDAEEDTTPREIYLNMRNILNVKEQGGRG